MSDHEPAASSMPTEDPTPPPARRAESHSGDKKDDNPIKSTTDRDRIVKEGLPIKDAPHHAYIDSGDSRNVRLSRDLIISLKELCGPRLDYLKRKASDEKGHFTELEEIVREVSPKIIKWANFLEGGPTPGENDHLTQADLDAVYYLLMDEVEQRGAMMGYEVFLHPTHRGWRPEAGQFSASRRGVETPYTKYLAAQGQDRTKIEEDLEKWEGVRINFEQALTGRGLRDRIFDRANWGVCRTSMFRRDRSELRLHTEILHALEESDEPVIRNFIATHGHIQRVTDLLVSLDSPAERNIAIKAYHEAISKASAKRFQLKADVLLKKNLERREAVWDEKGWKETAEENLKELEGEGQLTHEQKTELEGLRDGLKSIPAILRGVKKEDGTTQGGMPGRVHKLNEAIVDYNTYFNEHNLVNLRAQFTAAELTLSAYTAGTLPALNPPPDLQRLEQRVQDLGTSLTVAPSGLNLAQLTSYTQTYTSLVAGAEAKYSERLAQYRDIAQKEVGRLQAEITKVEGEINARGQKIRDEHQFVETDIPDLLITMTGLRDDLLRLAPRAAGGGARPPAAAYIANHVGLIDAQVDHLQTVIDYLNLALDGNPAGAPPVRGLKMAVNQTLTDYATNYNFQFDRNVFRDLMLPFEKDIKSYEEILKGEHNEERETRIKGVQLIQCIVEGGKDKDGTLGKTIARNLAEGQAGRILTETRNTHSLAPVRDVICNHPEILGAKKKKEDGKEEESLGIGDTFLWQRVFSDVFILQSYVEWSVRRGGLTIPPPPVAGGADFNLENFNDDFRQIVIDKMTSNHIDFGQFLNYLVEKRLHDADAKPEIQVNLREAEGVAATGIVTYNNHNRIGPAATIFAVEDNAEFAANIRTKENPYYTSPSAESEIDNIGVVDHSRSGFVHYLNITSPEHDPLTLDLVDAGAAAGAVPRRRNIPLSIHLRTTPSINGGRFQIYIQADPSLAGLGINRIGSLDRRRVNLLGLFDQIFDKKYNNFTDLETQIHNLLPNIPQADVGKYIRRSLGGYFLELSPSQRLTDFGRFPDAAINPAPGSYPRLLALGFQRISLDSSGVVELVRTVGGATTRISIDSALEGTFNIAGADRRLNATEVEELIRLTGEHVFNIVRR